MSQFQNTVKIDTYTSYECCISSRKSYIVILKQRTNAMSHIS